MPFVPLVFFLFFVGSWLARLHHMPCVGCLNGSFILFESTDLFACTIFGHTPIANRTHIKHLCTCMIISIHIYIYMIFKWIDITYTCLYVCVCACVGRIGVSASPLDHASTNLMRSLLSLLDKVSSTEKLCACFQSNYQDWEDSFRTNETQDIPTMKAVH